MVEKDNLAVSRPWRECAIVVCSAILCFAAALGPIYAFTIVSCVSTRSCETDLVLSPIGASCEEGEHLEEEMLHGEICTVRCQAAGRTPTVSELQCDDGFLQGGSELRCADIVTTPQPGLGIVGLVSGAIIGGDPGRVCVEARNLQCDAAPGDAGVLAVLYGLALVRCEQVLDECRSQNSNFLFVQHTGATSDEWTCTFGCQTPLLTQEIQVTQPQAQTTTTRSVSLQTPSLEARGCNVAMQGPICVHMTGSCNAEDNGDYYRADSCISGSPHWIKEDGSRRIRKDPVVQLSLGGRWLLEADFDLASDNYGDTLIARQPTFADELPAFGEQLWNFQCRVTQGLETSVLFEPLTLSLGDCSCTGAGDCSGNGQAIGSKDEGPDCSCICDPGYLGDKCETKFCEAPEIPGAYLPSCEEGQFIAPGATCTPNCEETRTASQSALTCVFYENSSVTALVPSAFECVLISDLFEEDTVATAVPTAPPPCDISDCNYRGLATGVRDELGFCECICDSGFSGDSCESREGSCRAPLPGSIANSAFLPCREGLNVSTGGVCTAECEGGFYPVPGILSCYGPGRPLTPETFTCFSSQPLEEQWCEIMQYVSLTSSGLAVVMLIVGCSVKGKRVVTKLGGTFFVKGTLIEHRAMDAVELEGDKGFMHVVRPAGGLAKLNAWQPNLRLVRKPKSMPELPVDAAERAEDSSLPAGGGHSLSDDKVKGIGDGASSGDAGGGSGELPGVPLSLRNTGSDLGDEVEEFGDELSPGPGQVPVTAWNSIDELGPEFFEVKTSPEWTEWLMHKQVLEDESNARRAEHDAKAEHWRRRSEFDAAADVTDRLRATEVARAEAEAAIVEAFSGADGDALKAAAEKGKSLLAQVSDAPRTASLSLHRLVHLADSRLLQYETKVVRDTERQKYEDRVRCGDAADWKMTQEELWEYVEQLNPGRVRAGLKAHLLVGVRTADEHRHTLLHIACKQLVKTLNNSSCGMEVIRELVVARANTSAIDASGRTPLDLLLQEGRLALPEDNDGLRESPPVVQELLELGLKQSDEAAELAKEERRLRELEKRRRRSSLVSPRARRQSMSRNSFAGSPQASPRGSTFGGRGSPTILGRGSLRADDSSQQGRQSMSRNSFAGSPQTSPRGSMLGGRTSQMSGRGSFRAEDSGQTSSLLAPQTQRPSTSQIVPEGKPPSM